MKNLHPRTKLATYLATACLALAPVALAVDPPPDGGYPGGNTALGEDALFSLDTTQGFDNSAIGFNALFSNTTGDNNTAVGAKALFHNTLGNANTAIGEDALFSNTTGIFNTAVGLNALFSNTTGDNNTAIGLQALEKNKTGTNNTAVGYQALWFNTNGVLNTAVGLNALVVNTGGIRNTAIGTVALASNKNGSDNIAVGYQAGTNSKNGNDNIYIGNAGGSSLESATIRIGTTAVQTATFVAGIREAPLVHGTAIAVGITADGQLGARASSARFKEAIKPMDKTSEAIFSLQPVTFRYKKAFDPQALPQFGLVAEQVAKVNPDLVARDAEGKPFTVRYDEVNAMLLNEFLKAHRKVEELEAIVTQLQAAFKAQAAQIQKVSDKLEASRPALGLVVTNQ